MARSGGERWASATEVDAIAVTGARDARVRGLYDGDNEAVDRVRRGAVGDA